MFFQTHKYTRLFIFFFIFLLFFITINLFFYSLISIGLYKFICYEKQSNLLEEFFFNKMSSIFYFLETLERERLSLFFFSNDSFYKYTFSKVVFFNEFLFFYDFLSSLQMNYFFYMKDISSTSYLKTDLNLIFLNFYIRSSHLNWIHSISLQKTIIINFNESSLFFFRIYNPSHIYLKLITLYMIYPNILTLYVNKIQCFCFNTIFLYPLEIVDLPVLIYIYPFLYFNFAFLNNIIIYYIVFLN